MTSTMQPQIILRYTFLIGGLCCVYFLISLSVAYHTLYEVRHRIDAAFSETFRAGEKEVFLSDERETLKILSAKLPDDAGVSVLKAKFYLSEQNKTIPETESFNIRTLLVNAYHRQPTYFEALPLEVLNSRQHKTPSELMLTTLRNRIPLALHEEETQLYVGPYLIVHWQVLPADIQSISLPLIRSGLRQQPTRRHLLSAMASSGNVSPFISLSPNRATSVKMQKLIEDGKNE